MTGRPIEILGIGYVAVDESLYVDAYPKPDTKVHVRDVQRTGGGNTAAALAAAAALGASVGLATRLGHDDGGRFALRELGRLGVDTSRVEQRADARTILSRIIVADDGSRTILGDLRDMNPLRPEHLRPEWFDGPRVLCVDHQHMPTTLAAARLAEARAMEVVSDIERDRGLLEETVAHVDHMICSAAFARSRTGLADPARAACALATPRQRSVVVTAGVDGCWWLEADDRRVRHLPAFTVDVRDTTGCGDMFHGAFAFARARDWPVREAVVLAAAVGALKASRSGGWAAAPRAHEVVALLSRHVGQPGVRGAIERLG